MILGLSPFKVVQRIPFHAEFWFSWQPKGKLYSVHYCLVVPCWESADLLGCWGKLLTELKWQKFNKIRHFLPPMSHRLSLSFCDPMMSIVSHQSTICLKQHLLLNHLVDSHKTSVPFQSCSKNSIQCRILVFMATKRKTLLCLLLPCGPLLGKR